MQHVNAGNKNVDAVLTADIDMGGYQWTPIASIGLYYKTEGSDKGYAGTFDGASHVISNFHMTASTTTQQTYANNILKNSKNEDMKDLVRVLYLYNQVANIYFRRINDGKV